MRENNENKECERQVVYSSRSRKEGGRAPHFEWEMTNAGRNGFHTSSAVSETRKLVLVHAFHL